MSETSETKGRCRSEVDMSGSGGPVTNAIADAIDRIAADVASIKEKVDAVSPEDVKHFVESEKAWVALVTEQRDAAVRERDEARALFELAQVQRTAAYADRDEARAEVYRLKCSMTETRKERDAAIRERDEWREEARLAVINRDEARAEVERLRAELAARPAANSSEIPDSSPADPPPAAPAAGWLTEKERRVLADHAQALREQRFALERGGLSSGYSMNPGDLKHQTDAIDALLARAGSPPEQTAALWLTEKERAVVEDIASMIEQWFNLAWSDTDEKRCAVLRSILARAGSPPVVVLPTVFARSLLGDELVALQQVKDAMDKAGVAWKEVPRE